MQEADLQAAARVLARLSLLMHRFPQIIEMDLNPVSLDDQGKGQHGFGRSVAYVGSGLPPKYRTGKPED